MNEQDILDYQRERFIEKGMSPQEVDRVFGTGEWAYEKRRAKEEAGDPYPFVSGTALVEYEAELPQAIGPPGRFKKPPGERMLSPHPVIGGEVMITNGQGVLPGAPPPGVMLTTYTNGGGALPDTSEIGIPALLAILAVGGRLLLGFIKALIAKVGWTTIAGILGTALAGKVLAMLNDGTPDNTDVLAIEGGLVGARIVKRWRANNTNFWMDSAGYMYAERRNGVIKRWRPKKPIVLVRGRTTLAGAVKAQRYLDHMWRTVAKRTKALKLA